MKFGQFEESPPIGACADGGKALNDVILALLENLWQIHSDMHQPGNLRGAGGATSSPGSSHFANVLGWTCLIESAILGVKFPVHLGSDTC